MILAETTNNKFLLKNQFFLGTMAYGLSTNLSLLLEHPFETIKTQWQKRNQINSISKITSIIYQEKGLGGFYHGLTPNLLKTSIKNLFRWPSMIFLPNFYKKFIEKSTLYFDSLPKILTGITISNVEVLVLTPLERLKVYLMTEKSNLSTFFNKHKGNTITELFKGLGPNYWKTNVGWFTFIVSDHYFKKMWKTSFDRKRLNYLDLLGISGLVGLATTLTTMPFDFLKTQAQLENSGDKVSMKKKSTFKSLWEYCSKNKFRTLYTGWNMRFSQTIINSIFAVILLEKLEHDFKMLH